MKTLIPAYLLVYLLAVAFVACTEVQTSVEYCPCTFLITDPKDSRLENYDGPCCRSVDTACGGVGDYILLAGKYRCAYGDSSGEYPGGPPGPPKGSR